MEISDESRGQAFFSGIIWYAVGKRIFQFQSCDGAGLAKLLLEGVDRESLAKNPSSASRVLFVTPHPLKSLNTSFVVRSSGTLFQIAILLV